MCRALLAVRLLLVSREGVWRLHKTTNNVVAKTVGYVARDHLLGGKYVRVTVRR